MQFQVVSDLHVETKGGLNAPASIYPKAKSPLLLVAGDTYPFSMPGYKEVIRRVAEPFQLALIIPGNHEYYGSRAPIPETNVAMREACNSIPNVVYLNKAVLNIGDTAFIGATCWTNVPKELWSTSARDINDYHMITGSTSGTTITPREVAAMHHDHAKWLAGAIGKAKNVKGCSRAVVMTHHAPSVDLAGEATARPRSLFPYYYSTDMGELIHDPFVRAWVHGHTHESRKIRLQPWGPIFVCNASGYMFERTGYFDGGLVEL